MPIEKEIKQEKFASEHQKAAINILFTASWLRTITTSNLKKFDITPEQFNVLRILRGSYPATLMLAEVASRMIDKNSNCTRLVEKLRQKKLVDRKICESNRRQVDILITETGLKLLSEIDIEQPNGIILPTSISAAEASELNRLLEKLRS